MKLPASLRTFSTLQITLAFSVLAHALLLSVRFVAPEQFDRVFQDTPLEVILVNAHTKEPPPEKAQAIAQQTLAGGGEAAKGRATSPLPYSALTRVGDDFEDAQKKADALLEQQTQLLAQLRRQVAALPPPDPRKPAQSEGEKAQEERRRQLVKILAEIERRINEENARPRKRYVTPSTREEVFAIYYDALRRKIEDKGTRNFPQLAGRPLYGQLVLQLTVGVDGNVTEAIVEHSSGSATLDRRAQAIARSAGPFGVVPAKVQNDLMRKGYNRLAFIQTFTFARDGTLETHLVDR